MRLLTNFKLHHRSLVFFHVILVLCAVAANTYSQVFCIPTAWAIALLIVCFATCILFPHLHRFPHFQPVLGFIGGISFSVFLYCVVFLEFMNGFGLAMILFFGTGLIVYIPHYFAVYLLWKCTIKPAHARLRDFFLLGITLSVSIAAFAGFQYKHAMKAIVQFEESGFQQLEKSFFTEKILGMHFIYHTRFCEFDGWRPPKHEPLLVVGMWLNGREDPLNVKLAQRVALYQSQFPEKPVKFNCSCAIRYGDNYHRDGLWE